MATDRSVRAVEKSDSEDAPAVLERLIKKAESAGASDIHLQMGSQSASVSFRLDGVITPEAQLPLELAERVFGRVKFLARLKTYQESLPQDGRIDRAAAHALNDIRVATYPTVTGEKIVLRLFNGATIKNLAELEFPPAALSELQRFLGRTTGLMLLTGPAGSGKTTTIYACLQHLAERGGQHIITVEDPAEQIIPGVMQTEINEDRGLDFATAARHLLRQDPQVLMLGEIRDEETANIAIRAALTGHLVISTLHAGSCKGVFERLLVLCRDHSAIATSVELVLNQRLVRRLCSSCSGKGCADCLQTGYRGRVPLVEWFHLQDTHRRSILDHNLDSLAAHPSLFEHAQTLLQTRLTDSPEVRRVLGAGIQ